MESEYQLCGYRVESIDGEESKPENHGTNQPSDWDKVKERLMDYYVVGRQEEGADAYPPLLLLKAMLLQKWFRIPSDPELENQINDRISFKKFLGLPFDQTSPDHSTFSRFRSRLSSEAMNWINNEVLQQFSRKGLTINEGIAIDARLIESASHPLNNDEQEDQKEKRVTPEGRVDKKATPLSSAGTWNLIGRSKTKFLIMV